MLETKQKSFRPVNKSEQESRTPGTRKYRKMEVRSTWKGHATSEGGEDGNPGGLYKDGVDMRILADQPVVGWGIDEIGESLGFPHRGRKVF